MGAGGVKPQDSGSSGRPPPGMMLQGQMPFAGLGGLAAYGGSPAGQGQPLSSYTPPPIPGYGGPPMGQGMSQGYQPQGTPQLNQIASFLQSMQSQQSPQGQQSPQIPQATSPMDQGLGGLGAYMGNR